MQRTNTELHLAHNSYLKVVMIEDFGFAKQPFPKKVFLHRGINTKTMLYAIQLKRL